MCFWTFTTRHSTRIYIYSAICSLRQSKKAKICASAIGYACDLWEARVLSSVKVFRWFRPQDCDDAYRRTVAKRLIVLRLGMVIRCISYKDLRSSVSVHCELDDLYAFNPRYIIDLIKQLVWFRISCN